MKEPTTIFHGTSRSRVTGKNVDVIIEEFQSGFRVVRSTKENWFFAKEEEARKLAELILNSVKIVGGDRE